MTFMATPPTSPGFVNSPLSTPSTPSFRLPSQPTILLKPPSDETIARLRQLAPYYWSHPQTTNCAIHFPIDPRQQARIQAYQSRQRQGGSGASSRSRQGSVSDRRPSQAASPSSSASSPSGSMSRQSSSNRLRSALSGSGLSAKAAILGNASSSVDHPVADAKRRGSLTPGYDPFSKGGTSLVVQQSNAALVAGPSGRRESVPVQAGQNLAVPQSPTPEILRRGSAPVTPANKNVTPMRTVRLHVEYLTAHSALIRQVMAEAAGYVAPSNPATPTTNSFPNLAAPPPSASSSSSHLATPPPEGPSLPSSPSSTAASSANSSPTTAVNPFPHSFFRFSPHRYPRVIHPKPTPSNPNPPSGPIIILPVPDPVSFPLLIHYIYHGKMDAIERTLREGQVSWEGLVRNVEYLGLREDVKRYLGRWWKNWRDSGDARTGRAGASAADEDDDEDSSSRYPYPSPMDVDGDGDTDVSEWTHSASANAASGELVDEMAGLLGRF